MNSVEQSNPTEVARETIKQLVGRRIVPTPDNYAKIYSEISGIPQGVGKNRLLRGATAPQGGAVTAAAGESTDALAWAPLIRALWRGLDTRHATLTLARKRESLEHVLAAFGADSASLHARLSSLEKAWSRDALEQGGPIETLGCPAVLPSAREAALVPAARIGSDREAVHALRELLASTLQYGVVERLGYSPNVMDAAAALAGKARDASTPAELEQLSAELKQFWIRLEMAGESQAQLMQGIRGLMEMLLNNVGDLVADDRWLHGQLDRIRDLLAGPLEPKTIREVENSFRELVYKQGTLKHGLDQAKSALKDMLSTFIERLGTVVSNTGDYHDRIGRHVERIQSAENLPQMAEILDQIMGDTRGMQSDMMRTRDELQSSRERVLEQEQRIAALQQDLEAASALVREDPLTHVLNRRGFQEAWAVEVARTERGGTPLCVGLLDLDNFKQLNDRLGHVAGDDALVHLTAVVRSELRPSDVVARYGGEEFVILLPETGLEEATSVMTRVQRSLTRRFFLHNNEKVLITFSAGVVLRRAGEGEVEAVERADQALYQAKQAGKNRVVAA